MRFTLTLSPADELSLRLIAWCFEQRCLPDHEAAALAEEGSALVPELERRAIQSLYYLASAVDAPEQRFYDRFLRAQSAAAKGVLEVLAAHRCAPVLWKGAELVPRSFGDRAVGAANDFDILVPRRHLGRAVDAMREVGFVQADLPDRSKPKIVPRGGVGDAAKAPAGESSALAKALDADYSLKPFMKLGELTVPPDEVDVVKRLAAPRTPDARGWNRPPLDGKAWIISDADHLWVLANKWYLEVQRFAPPYLRVLAILSAFLARADVDWDVVTGAAEALDAEPCIYYPLALIDFIHGGGLVPAEALDALRPDRFRWEGRRYDSGWQLDKLFGGRLIPEW
jgi:hypothetical protein